MQNTSGDYSLSGKIFIIENVQNIKENSTNSLADVATIISVDMLFGCKVNAVWGDSNSGLFNIAHIISNDNKTITKIVLKKTEDSFNFDCTVLKTYTQSSGIDMVQGGVYGKDGYIYLGLGHEGA